MWGGGLAVPAGRGSRSGPDGERAVAVALPAWPLLGAADRRCAAGGVRRGSWLVRWGHGRWGAAWGVAGVVPLDVARPAGGESDWWAAGCVDHRAHGRVAVSTPKQRRRIAVGDRVRVDGIDHIVIGLVGPRVRLADDAGAVVTATVTELQTDERFELVDVAAVVVPRPEVGLEGLPADAVQ